MAKKGGKSKGYKSAGIHSNLSTNTKRLIKTPKSEKILNQHKAHKAGKRVMVTISNPNKDERNKPFIKVLSTEVWKDPKKGYSFSM